MSISDCQDKISISIDVKNDELPTIFIKNLATRKFYYERIRLGSSAEFVNSDNHVLYIKKEISSHRDFKLVVHRIGDKFQEEDFDIFEEADEQNWLNLELSGCRKWLHLIQVSKDGYGHFVCKKSEFDLLANSGLSQQEIQKKLKNSFVKIADKVDGVREIKINESGATFQGSNDAIHFVPIQKLNSVYESLKNSGESCTNFQELFEPIELFNPQTNLDASVENVIISDLDFYEDQLILYCQKITEAKILQIDLKPFLSDSKDSKDVIPVVKNLIFSENQLGTLIPYPNNNPSSTQIKFHFSSPYAAEILYSLDLPLISSEENSTVSTVVNIEESHPEVRILSSLEQPNIPSFETEILHIPSRDKNITIPVTFLSPVKKSSSIFGSLFGYSKKSTKFSSDKLLIKSYGCYGLSSFLEYSPEDIYLLSQGFSIAYAHIRGGSEKGSDWHEQARKEKKMASVQDLNDVIRHFRVNSRFSSYQKFSKRGNLLNFPAGIFAQSDSAGATILMSAVNSEPDALDGVILSAPFLNLKTLEDENQALSQSDWLEFGKWSDPKEAEVLTQLCPLTQLEYMLETKSYEQMLLPFPPIYIQAYSNDYRTPLWTIVDYVKKFRKLNDEMEKSGKKFKNGSKFHDIGIALNIKDGSHKGASGDPFLEKCEKIAFMEWLSEDLIEQNAIE